MELPTYNDFKRKSRIFEAEEIKGLTQVQINEAEEAFDELVARLEKGQDIEEGFLSGLIGGAAGAIAGPAIGRAICKALGIKENGTLGKMLTSRLVTTAIGVALGK